MGDSYLLAKLLVLMGLDPASLQSTTHSKGDLPTYGVDLRLAGIGGLSSVVGWTEVQQEEARANKGKNKGFRLEGVFKLLGGFLAADLLLYIYLTAGGSVPWAS